MYVREHEEETVTGAFSKLDSAHRRSRAAVRGSVTGGSGEVPCAPHGGRHRHTG